MLLQGVGGGTPAVFVTSNYETAIWREGQKKN